MQNINFTFIIPHKNCPELLQRCIKSIPAREDVQIVVVDDNSDCDLKPIVSRENTEVILLDVEHSKGAGRARNVGLEHAKGKWLLFADADDYYSDILDSFLDDYKDDDVTDIVYINASMIDENGKQTSTSINRLINNYIKREAYSELELKYEFWTPWTRMVKKHIVDDNSIRFDEIPAANDKMFGLECGRYSENIQVCQNIIYYYYRPSFNSITDKQRNKNMYDAIMDLRGRTIVLLREVQYHYTPSFFELAFSSSYAKNMGLFELLKRYFQYLNKYHISVFRDVYCYIIRRKYYRRCYQD